MPVVLVVLRGGNREERRVLFEEYVSKNMRRNSPLCVSSSISLQSQSPKSYYYIYINGSEHERRETTTIGVAGYMTLLGASASHSRAAADQQPPS